MALLVCLLLSVPISRLLTAPVLRLVRFRMELLELGGLLPGEVQQAPAELIARMKK